MNVADVLTLIGDVAAVTAALFAFLALGRANDAIQETKAQRIAAEEASREAAQAAKEAAEDRRAANAEARAARQEALKASKEASADRIAAAKFAESQQRWEQEQRLAERVERVGEIVEAIFWITGEDRELEKDPRRWWPLRNRLGQAMVGLSDRLPKCAELLNQHLSGQAFGVASQARNQVETELKYLRHELYRPPE